VADYRLTISKSAYKELEKLPSKVFDRLYPKIKKLPENPFPIGSKKLIGSSNKYRMREGDYRLIYMLEKNEIIIIAAKHRREVYRD
jgi:mRNA interferase RelE/StbE